MKKKLILLLFVFTVINIFGQVPTPGEQFSNKAIKPVTKVPLDEALVLIYDYDGTLFSFDLESEQIGWTIKATDAHTEMCANQLTLQDGVVYVPFINGEIFAIDNLTGDIFWKSRLGNTTDQIVLKDQTPVINNGKLYITSQGQNSAIYALNIKDGSLAWSHKVDDASNPVSVLFFNNKVFTQSGSNLYSFDAGTGKLLNQKTFDEAISGKPVTDDENIFIANEKDVVYALSPDKLDVLWQFKIEENQHSIKDRIFSKNKKVYFAAQGEMVSSLYAVDSKTGTQLWKTDFKNDNVQYITEKDDNLWGYTRKGKLFQLDIDNGETAFEAKLTTNPISNLEFPDDDSLFYYSDAALIQFEYKTKDENEVYLRTSIKDDVYNAYIKVLRP